MIYIDVINRSWNPGVRFIKDKQELRDFHYYIANRYSYLIKKAIDTQRYRQKWADLTPKYLQWKSKHGLSEKIWEATGELKNAIRVYRQGIHYRVGFDRRRKHRHSRVKYTNLARYLEYGTRNMPARPLFRNIYNYMSKNIRMYYKNFKLQRGDLS